MILTPGLRKDPARSRGNQEEEIKLAFRSTSLIRIHEGNREEDRIHVASDRSRVINQPYR